MEDGYQIARSVNCVAKGLVGARVQREIDEDHKCEANNRNKNEPDDGRE